MKWSEIKGFMLEIYFSVQKMESFIMFLFIYLCIILSGTRWTSWGKRTDGMSSDKITVPLTLDYVKGSNCGRADLCNANLKKKQNKRKQNRLTALNKIKC